MYSLFLQPLRKRSVRVKSSKKMLRKKLVKKVYMSLDNRNKVILLQSASEEKQKIEKHLNKGAKKTSKNLQKGFEVLE